MNYLFYKKVSIILPDLRGGGAERVAVKLANGFSERGYTVEVVLLSATGEFLVDLRPDIKIVDLKFNEIRWFQLPLILPLLIKYLRESRPEVILSLMWPLTVIVPLARFLARVHSRVVVSEHTTWSQGGCLKHWSFDWQVRTSMHLIFPHVDGIVIVSEAAADDLASFADLDRKRINVIYNPIVGEEALLVYDELPPVGWWTGPHRRILAVGSLSDQKDFGTLLQAFAVLQQRTDTRLLILGEGVCRHSLEEQCRKLGIEDNVFMPGFVKDPMPYYAHADLYVLSSKAEGLPTVLIEALAAGTPVVSTDCPSGPREILQGGKIGWLVPVGDSEALSKAMGESLSEKHDPSVLKQRAQDFSIKKALDKYEKLLFP